MSVPRYPEYKDSGVEWLGDVPKHWNLRKMRWLCEIKKRIAGELGHEVLSITQQGIRVRDLESNDGQLSMDYSKYQLVEVGDFAMNHMDLLTGYVDVSTMHGVTSPDYRVFSIREPATCHDKYLLYLLQMGYKNKIFYAYGQGSSQLGRWRLPSEQFKELPFPLPPLIEQRRIADFLDRETAKIDALIAEQLQLIALLKEKRQAVISHAVTKGLNPNVPMKDSGIEWLGEMPAHWKRKRLRFVADFNPSKSEVSDVEKMTEVSFVPMEAIGDNGALNLERTHPIAEVENGYTYFRDGDVTIAKITPCFENGKGAIMKGLQSGIGFGSTELIVVRPKAGEMICNYLHWLFLSQPFRKLGEAAMYGAGGQKRIPDEFVRNFTIAIPDVNEQALVAAFLDHETAKIDTLIESVLGGRIGQLADGKSLVGLLKERRSALISAAVTGKIDVCNQVAVEAL